MNMLESDRGIGNIILGCCPDAHSRLWHTNTVDSIFVQISIVDMYPATNWAQH